MGNGHNSDGTFAKGNQVWKRRKSNNGGRHKLQDLEDLRAVIDADVSADSVSAAWKRIDKILETGGPGWRRFFELYLDRRYGKPAQYIEADVTSDGESIAPMFREVVVNREPVGSQ
jgi:hypothetical protein